MWFKGERFETNHSPTIEENAAAWPQMERTYRALRILLVPIDGDDKLRTRIESAIARHFWQTCDACRRFMCPPRLRRPPNDLSRLSIELGMPDDITICGINGPIQE
jgi:hypothetical protein